MTRGAGWTARAPVFALAAVAWGAVCLPGAAAAEPRFGDSTWVAPSAPALEDSAFDGPRVAQPDHERAWETALRAPFRVVFLPLRIVARGMEAGAGRYGERLMGPKQKPPSKRFAVGFRLDPGGAAEGDLADIGLGPSMTISGFPTPDAKLKVDGSWTPNDRRRGRLVAAMGEGRVVGLLLRADYDYRPDLRYYGIGNDAKKSDRAYYLLENTDVEAAIVFGASSTRQLRLVGGYSGMSPRHGYNASPLLEERFEPSEVPYFHDATLVYLYGVTADLSSLNDTRDPSLGLHGHAELRRAEGATEVDPDFIQWLFECRGYLPVFANRRVIAVRVAYSGLDPTSGGTSELPFYRLPMSDGPLRFAGYESQLLRDRQLILARVEYRWAIWRRLSAVALYDFGEVAPYSRALKVQDAHTAYGGGVRLGTSDGHAFRLDVANGDEGINAVLRIGTAF